MITFAQCFTVCSNLYFARWSKLTQKKDNVILFLIHTRYLRRTLMHTHIQRKFHKKKILKKKTHFFYRTVNTYNSCITLMVSINLLDVSLYVNIVMHKWPNFTVRVNFLSPNLFDDTFLYTIFYLYITEY